jgi:hypothetical protein
MLAVVSALVELPSIGLKRSFPRGLSWVTLKIVMLPGLGTSFPA